MSISGANDRLYMHRCLQLARCGVGSTSPNPMVGAVIVCDGRIIGEGYHIRAGEPHAEVNAVNSVKECDRSLLALSTIYVSLEPCSHYGKTPPCCDLIISCGIPRVVIGTTDYNAQVNGGGIERMRAAGIEVTVDVLQAESYRLNEPFFTFHRQQRPFVTLKWAQSGDGFVDRCRDGGEALRISNPISSISVHKLRASHDAIFVGRRTALLDNPSLDIRHWVGRRPLRLVVDRMGTLPDSLRIFTDGFPTVIYTSAGNNRVYGDSVECVVLDFESDIIPQVLAHLHSIRLNSLLVEGGPRLLQSFIDSSLWDVARVEVNGNIVVGSGVAAPALPLCKVVEKSCSGGNEVTIYRR
ncbi:MAG: bifunctional diaminohydroxyphosphoribosylaminopyrimidine deaminase/5-amino-6-(5-phosphoribosylamino)uracil reductase RibD [Bacteroidaceae bacterium]|nr:bifunctional diaminohydroxyphosphoribosylaminopyrimidine deaminase/5-amino-6-(5-phosphoribosylamino)uracil reductase RibD [Bacteroidaceae bacterium]